MEEWPAEISVKDKTLKVEVMRGVLKVGKEEFIMQVLSLTHECESCSGRPKETRRTTIESDKRTNELIAEAAKTVAANREVSRRFIADLWTN